VLIAEWETLRTNFDLTVETKWWYWSPVVVQDMVTSYYRC